MGKLKCAVLIFGPYREFDTVHNSWSFMENYECDYYISTWDRNKMSHKGHGVEINEVITKEMILSKLPNATIAIKEDDDRYLNNNCKMSFHWKTCLQLLEESNEEYDICLLTRFDNFTTPFNSWNDIDKNEIYTEIDNKPFMMENVMSLNDYFYLGNIEKMKEIIRKFPVVSKDPHGDMYNVIKELNINFISLFEKNDNTKGVQIIQARPNSRGMKNLEYNRLVTLNQEWCNGWDKEFIHPDGYYPFNEN